MKNIFKFILILLTIHSQAQTFYTETITGSRQYLGQTNQAILEIKFADNNSTLQIQKPLIVVEGYDSGLLGFENEFGEVDLQKFINSTYREISNLPSQINTYDIIYINFKKGNDYMQRNAYLVEDVIKWVNSVKQGTQQNVVLGQSMGGVIARYALRDMENQLASTGNQNWNHKTNLYISHDAPHQGANMPLAIQYFARHLVDQFVSTPLGDMNINLSGTGGAVSISDLETLLNQPGTKQLLNNYVASNFSINNSEGDSWRTELRNIGYPQQTRNIALSNGSHCANPQNFNPSDNLFLFNGSGQTKFLTDLLLYIIPYANLISGVSMAVLFNEPGLLIGILPGNSKFQLDFWGNALPTAGSTNQIYHGNIKFTKTLFKLFGWAPKITVTLTNRNYSAPATLSYDYYPGGKYQSFITGGGTSASTIFGNFGIQMSARDNFNFIPTPSALDIGNGSVALNNADFFAKYNSKTPPTAPKNSPFINFSTSYNTSGINENHISFNTRNGNWLALELDNNASNNDNFDCSYICTSNQITGPNTVCSSATYSAPSGANYYDWTITQGSNLVNLTGNFTNTITLSPTNSNSAGQVTLSLFFGSGDCGDIILTKTIWVGKPSIEINLTSNSNYVTIDLVGAEGTDINQQGITATTWTQTASTNGGSAGGSGFSGFGNGPNFYWTATLAITATNACGTTSITRDVTCAPPAPCDTSYNLVAKSTSGYTVNKIIEPCAKTANQKTVAASANEIVSAKLYDMSNIEIRNYRTNDYSVEGVKKGIYILKVQVKDIMLTKKIIVN